MLQHLVRTRWLVESFRPGPQLAGFLVTADPAWQAPFSSPPNNERGEGAASALLLLLLLLVTLRAPHGRLRYKTCVALNAIHKNKHFQPSIRGPLFVQRNDPSSLQS